MNQLPKPNVEVRKSGESSEWTEQQVRGIFCNPIYAGVGKFTAIRSEREWIEGAAQMIKEEGAEQFLVNLLSVLRICFPDEGSGGPPKKAAQYARGPETRGSDAPYDEKFENLIKLCQTAKASGVVDVVVAFPWVLGDTHEEIVESLTRLSNAGLTIHIVPNNDKPMTDRIHLN